ncbi:hypothetical protein V2A60_001882 [Cordyceps javanica]
MKTFLAVVAAFVTGAISLNVDVDLFLLGDIEVEIYTTATERDVSTKFVTQTAVSTFTTSYPVTVTSLVNCTKKPPASTTAMTKRTHPTPEPPAECDTVTTTEWRTETSTKTVLVPTVSVVPTTVTDVRTVTHERTTSITQWMPTTYTATVTRTSWYPVTVTSPHNVTVTSTSTTTETVVMTITTSYPVTSYWTVTKEGPTVTVPGPTVTATRPITRVTDCPAPTGSHVPLDPDSDLTFGCKPGTVCSPPMPADCNMWPGPPQDDFVCGAGQCIPSPPFTPVHWKENETSYYPPPRGFFNLDPGSFGLTNAVFEDRRPVDFYSKKAYAAPSHCFDECNNAYIAAEAEGKTDALCRPRSSFMLSLELCKRCVRVGTGVEVGLETFGPSFTQFVNFCNGSRSEPTRTAAPVPSGPASSPPTGPDSGLAPQPHRTTVKVTASSGGFELPTSSAADTPLPQTRPGTTTRSQPPATSGAVTAAEPNAPEATASEPSAPEDTASEPAPKGKTVSGSSAAQMSRTGSTGSGPSDVEISSASNTVSGTSATSSPRATPAIIVTGGGSRFGRGTIPALVVAVFACILI